MNDRATFPSGGAGRRLLMGGDGADAAGALLTAGGWTVVAVADAAALVAQAATADFALCWLCGPIAGTPAPNDALAARIARLPPPRGALPMLVTPPGAPPPSEAQLHALIDAAPRAGTAPPDPLARLTPLFGAAAVAGLMTRFRSRLADLLSAADPYAIGEGDTPAMLAHRLVGMAGMLDFGVLAAAWERVETEGPAHLPDAWTETRIARATLDLLLG